MVDTYFYTLPVFVVFNEILRAKYICRKISRDHQTESSAELNRDGRPSGFARVIFESEEAVGECCCCVGYNGRCKDPRKSRDKRMNRTYNF